MSLSLISLPRLSLFPASRLDYDWFGWNGLKETDIDFSMTSHQKIFKVVSTTSKSQYPTFSLFSASFSALERESTIMQSSQRWDKWPVMLFWNESVSWGTKGVLIEPNEDWVLGKQAFQGFADASLISTQRYNALSVLLQMPVSCRAYLLSYNIKSDTSSLYVYACKHMIK